ncbi:unnamed protein product, partial [Acanthocheilonema viteae]
CVSQFSPAGNSYVWTTDDLLPAFVYVTIRAQLQHLGAEIRLIEDFAPQLEGSGQIELMFTTLRARINMFILDGLWLNLSKRTNNNIASALLITTILCTILTIVRPQQQQQQQRQSNLNDNDNLYILIDEISVYTCRGAKNEIKLTEDDINIVNEKGNRVYFIKAPGKYSLHFKKLVVTKNIGYLSGEIGVTLQVPIIEGPAGIRFDLPYTVVPETGILDQECDKYSGVIERGNRQYCRYCDICGLTAKLETDLNNKGHLFLPEVARGTEEKFAPFCNRIASNIYEFNRTINLPGRRELEMLINEKVQGLDGEIRQRLNKKRGRFQVFLNLISAEQPAIKQDDWFAKSADVNVFLQCFFVLLGTRRTSPHLSDIGEISNVVQTLTERCVAKMPQRLTHLRRYCAIFWNDKLCCSHCPDVCQS